MAAQDFVTQLLQLGVAGIDLKSSVDQVNAQRLARMTNFVRDEIGRLAGRPGQQRYAWADGEEVHTIARIQKVLAGGEFKRLFGVGTELHAGQSGALHKLTDGFSGQPLTTLPGHPPLSGDAWEYVADSAKMVKVRASDELTMPIGLAPPTAAASPLAKTKAGTIVELFDVAGWTNNAGTGAAGTNTKVVSSAGYQISFVAAPGAAPAGYYNFWSKAEVVDMSVLNTPSPTSGTVTIPATNDDEVTLSFQIAPASNAALIDEIRIYFVLGPGFDATILPGSSASTNIDYYFKSFVPTSFIPLGQLSTGIGSWSQWGAIGAARRGLPLRRGQFSRGGTNPLLTWKDVTGLVIYLHMNTNSAAQISFADAISPPELGMAGGITLQGGYGPDNVDPTSVQYDYIYRNVDPRTGAKSRYSAASAKFDAVRQAVQVIPAAYGDSAIRQEFFRRGGTLPSDFYFVGQNTADGGIFTDDVSDATARASGSEGDTDFHQPITTIDLNGKAVYAQPIPIIFGPAPGAGILLGLGDPYRPGNIYWTLPDQYDHWPLGNTLEVCSPAEELMNGGVFGGQAFCFSRSALYGLLINIINSAVQAQPTTCRKGLAGRWAMAIGLDAVYFVAPDGVWKTTGGTPEVISNSIEPLFMGLVKNGYFPINFEAPHALRLAIYKNELWLLFQDTNGDRQVWIYSLLFQFWRHAQFGNGLASLLPEDQDQLPPQLLMGASDSGRVYAYTGVHDDGLAITAHLRTGALNQGLPRQHKLYGDVELEGDFAGVSPTVTTLADLETKTVAAVAVVPQSGPYVYLIDAFGSTPLLAHDVSIDFSITYFSSIPWVGRCGPSAVPQPEASIRRLTEWDNLGVATNKLVKGVLVEADTFNFLKTLQVMLDGSTTPATSFTLQHNGRKFSHIAFDSQLDARLVRLVPNDSSPWIPYQIRWIFDEDPLELKRWETQAVDHGIPIEQTLIAAYVTLRSSAVVTLTIQLWRQDGSTTSTTITIPSTSGVKTKKYITLPALKGLLFKYTFTSDQAHRLFREESMVFVQPWGGDKPVTVQPFGTDDLDQMRFVRDAEGASLRGQRYLQYGGGPNQEGTGNAG